MKKSDFKLETALEKKGCNFIIGIDEAGRGPLAGPVVAAAATVRKSKILNPKIEILNIELFDLIRDSKTLSSKQREKLFDFIHEHFYVGVGICDHKTIDRINILQATFLAAKKAIADLQKAIGQDTRNKNQTNFKSQITKTIILFDGNRKIPNISIAQRCVPNGDKLVKSISAASIIAKVTRDRIMHEMHRRYPRYGFNKHKGYGTKLHLKMLHEYGPCEIHRKSFKPVKLAKYQE
jgi:ribonuclease HII